MKREKDYRTERGQLLFKLQLSEDNVVGLQIKTKQGIGSVPVEKLIDEINQFSIENKIKYKLVAV